MRESVICIMGMKRWFLLIVVVGLVSIIFLLAAFKFVIVQETQLLYPVVEYKTPLSVDIPLELNTSCSVRKTVDEKFGNKSKTYTILIISEKPWACVVDLSCCRYSKCVMTQNHTRFSDSDVVLFSAEQFPLDNFGINDIPFHKRPANQIWVFTFATSPLMIPRPGKYPFPFRSNAFNWSMSYRLDSEIPYPLGTLRTQSNPVSKDYEELLKSKTGFSAWLVSNCNRRTTRRIEYVQQLKQSMPVDVYGGCGEMFDGPAGDRRIEWGDVDQLLNKYKFYLSFEDAKCKDYVTEKVYERWNLDVVLVVRGGTNYAKLLPNGTYINADWFNTPKALAAYLKWLDSSPGDYISILRAKDRFVRMLRGRMYINAMCTICRNLHNLNKYRHVYEDVESWIFENKCYPETDVGAS